jgi:hypothetical protein
VYEVSMSTEYGVSLRNLKSRSGWKIVDLITAGYRLNQYECGLCSTSYRPA